MKNQPATGKGSRALRRIDGRTRHGLPLRSIMAACLLKSDDDRRDMLKAIKSDLMRSRKWTATLAASWRDAVRFIGPDSEE